MVDRDVSQNVTSEVGEYVQRVGILEMDCQSWFNKANEHTIKDHAVAFSVPSTVPLMLTVGVLVAFEPAVDVEPRPVTVVDACDTVDMD